MMTLDKTIQEKKEMSISKWISDKICSYCNVDKKNYQKMKYGIDIIYIYKLSKKISYHNFLVRKKETIPYYEIASFMYSKI